MECVVLASIPELFFTSYFSGKHYIQEEKFYLLRGNISSVEVTKINPLTYIQGTEPAEQKDDGKSEEARGHSFV